MKKIIIAYAALIVILIILAVFRSNIFGSFKGIPNPFSMIRGGSTQKAEATVTINKQKIGVSVADTKDELQKGLSVRDSLADNEGMLFVFPQPGKYPFWMRDMKFAIDIIFIRDNKVIEVFRNVQPPKDNASIAELPTYVSDEPATHVLEVKAGLAEKYDITGGDTVTIEGLKR